MNIYLEVEKQRKKSLPFVAYRKPNSDTLIAFFQKDNQVHQSAHLNETGFVFTSFLNDERIVFPESDCTLLIQNIKDTVVDFSPFVLKELPIALKAFHEQLVVKGVSAIKGNAFEKVVLSRREQVTINAADYLLYFKRLVKAYMGAFCYWWYHPEIGEWMGATPEQLLKAEEKTIKTVALAGTQLVQEKEPVEWQEKEKEEQQIVTDFIVSSLQPYTAGIEVTEPYTYKAGTVMHIKTDIQAMLKDTSDFEKVVNALHPTPALCGFPKNEAQKFITENEGYNRAFYSGYLGELNKNFETQQTETSDLFVNLRCMQLKSDKAYLYLGGGITKDSIPESEFFETVNKSKTIKKIL